MTASNHKAALLGMAQFGGDVAWPITYNFCAPKRCVTPQGYWSSHDLADIAAADLVLECMGGSRPGNVPHEDPLALCYLRSMLALGIHAVPTWHVSKDITRALLRTVPPNWPLEHFKMPFAGVRLVLERGAFILEDGSEVVAVQAGHFEQGDSLAFPAAIVSELSSIAERAQDPHP